MQKLLDTIAAGLSARWTAWRARAERRRMILDLLRRSDPILDDIGYSRPILKAMLEETSAQPLDQEARRRSSDALKTPDRRVAIDRPSRLALRMGAAASAGCASPRCAAASGGAY